MGGKQRLGNMPRPTLEKTTQIDSCSAIRAVMHWANSRQML